ncbi:branched-chain amino acid transport system II carrier protein [[Clostridium] dakarense]|uniref:branched-chain amino acid transport system II carrier protein n=1 Tax=Faecalimicrobium dakarense TaxID=1301100 RepID=UPI0004B032F6|nr:branched-chain amino acid transport system II carrier protein [[Clostridium] dakarense]
MKKFKDIVIVGFALFSLLFGAGNLIFPPYIGVTSGSQWIISFLGFLFADVGIIVLSIISVARAGSYQTVVQKAGEKFGFSLEVIMMLCLGPILVVPRTAATTFEMSVQPLFSSVNPIIFSVLFFTLTLMLTIRPTKVMDIIGKFLTPILLITLAILIIKGILSPIGDLNVNIDTDNLFSHGINQGYQTMGALGVGGVVALVMSSFLSKGYNDATSINLTIKAALLAAVGLVLVYTGLAYLGATASNIYNSNIPQTTLLVNISNILLGNTGSLILAVVVAFACLTTSIGLTSVTSKYFEDVTNKKLKYEYIVVFICVFSTIVSNFGVDKIISISVPILTVIYPVSLILVIMSFFRKLLNKDAIYKGAAYATLLTSLLTVVDNLNLGINLNFIQKLPFSSLGLNWVVPAVVGGFLGFILSTQVELNKAKI